MTYFAKLVNEWGPILYFQDFEVYKKCYTSKWKGIAKIAKTNQNVAVVYIKNSMGKSRGLHFGCNE